MKDALGRCSKQKCPNPPKLCILSCYSPGEHSASLLLWPFKETWLGVNSKVPIFSSLPHNTNLNLPRVNKNCPPKICVVKKDLHIRQGN